MGDGAGGAPRRHAGRGDDAGRTRLHRRREERQVQAAGDADRGARLGAGARRQERAPSTRARAGPGRSPPSTRAAARAPSGTRATNTSCRCSPPTTSTLRRDLRGGDPLQGRPRRPRRGARRLRRRGGARAGAVRRLAVRGGQRLRALVGGRGLGGPGPAAAPKGTKITAAASGSPASAGSLPRPGQRKAKAALYRIDADGRMEQMFSIPDGYFTTLAFDDAGRAYVGTGSEGRVYRVSADRTAALAIDVSERQALALLRAGNGFLVGTGDVGGVYRAAPAAPRQATYLSRVLDGEYRSRWGLFRWHGSHDVAIESRSGNTAKPDTTWTGFAAARAAARRPRRAASARSPARPRATSSTARRFGAPDGGWRAVTLAYLPQNQRARITELGPADSGAPAPAIGALGALAATATTPAAARAHQPVHQAALEGGEPRRRRAELPARLPPGERRGLAAAGRPRPADQDRIRLEHRGAARRDLRRQGHRQRRALASRASARWRRRSRPRRSWSTTASPRWSASPMKYPYVSGRARDDQSPLVAMEYAIDGGEWQILSPADGICDDLVESFTIKLPRARARAARGHRARLGQRRQRRRRRDHDQVAGQMTVPGATTRPGCRRRPRSSRSRSACSRTSARSSTVRTRAWPRSSIRPGRSIACCARRSGWA